jgi:hypothetical protein
MNDGHLFKVLVIGEANVGKFNSSSNSNKREEKIDPDVQFIFKRSLTTTACDDLFVL